MVSEEDAGDRVQVCSPFSPKRNSGLRLAEAEGQLQESSVREKAAMAQLNAANERIRILQEKNKQVALQEDAGVHFQ